MYLGPVSLIDFTEGEGGPTPTKASEEASAQVVSLLFKVFDVVVF